MNENDKYMKQGTIIGGKYEILKKIGQGGMSIVYLVMDTRLNKNWALKEVRKDGIKDYEIVKQGLVVETDMLKKLNHPNLPRIVDIIDEDGAFYVIMDYIEGQPLNEVLSEYGAQPQDLVIDWAKQICDVLNYLHGRIPPIIYRDMKPDNIMLKPEGNLTLIDFGIAREFKEKNIADTTCLGTVGYAAPEQFGNQGQTDQRTDIYCLGATLYHLITGKNPSEPPYEIVPICSINSALSSGLERIITKCTQRNPDDRYQSCAEMMYDLEHYNEIDDKFKKRQVKKLVAFIVPLCICIVSLCFSFYCYASIKNEQRANYDNQLSATTSLASESIYQQEYNNLVVEQYTTVIEIDPTREEAYSRIIDYCSGIGQTQAGLDVVCIAVDSGKGNMNQNNELLLKIATLYFGGNNKDASFNVNYLKAAKYYGMIDIEKNPETQFLSELANAMGSFSTDVDWNLVVSTLAEFKVYNDKQTLTTTKVKNNQLAAGVYIINKREFMAMGVDPYKKSIELLLQAESDIENLQSDVEIGTLVDDEESLLQLQREVYESLASNYYTAYTVESTETDYDKSIEYFNLLLTIEEDLEKQKDIEFTIADVIVQKGVKSEIEEIYNTLMMKYPNEAKVYLDYAVYCFNDQQLEESTALYKKASKCDKVEENSNYSKLGIKLKNAGQL